MKLYHKIKQLEAENKRLELLMVEILTVIPDHFLIGHPDWDNELTRIEESEFEDASNNLHTKEVRGRF